MSGNYINFLEKSMDLSNIKRNLNAENISNINTPGYKSGSVEFDLKVNEELISVKKTKERHLNINDNEEIKIIRNNNSRERYDENNVDLNKEMIDMIKNNHTYGLSVQAINKEFTLNKTALGKQ